MGSLIKTVRAIVWVVVLTLTATIAGVYLYATYMVVRRTDWESFEAVCKTLGMLFVFIVLTLLAGGFVLWVIREHVLPLSSEERKEKSQTKE